MFFNDTQSMNHELMLELDEIRAELKETRERQRHADEVSSAETAHARRTADACKREMIEMAARKTDESELYATHVNGLRLMYEYEKGLLTGRLEDSQMVVAQLQVAGLFYSQTMINSVPRQACLHVPTV